MRPFRFLPKPLNVGKIIKAISDKEKPDLIILGGASGVDYLAERWAGNYAIPLAIFNEAWNEPRKGFQDHGRPEAPSDLSGRMLERATHLIAFPGPESKWTKVMVEHARMKGIPTAVVPVPVDG